MRLTTRKSGILLWGVQGLLAALFLFAGGMKLVMPIEMMKGPVELPGLLLRFIGVVEVLGAIGLILPELLRIKRVLTPLAAAGLVIVMTGATVITLVGGDVAPALVPFMVGLLAAVVAYGRWRPAPRSASRPAVSGVAVLQRATS
jgi:hypothetical protein